MMSPHDSIFPRCHAASAASLACIGLITGSGILHATDYTWIGTDGDWSKAANWGGSGAPPAAGAHRIQIGTSAANGSNTYLTRAIYSSAQGDITFSGGTSARSLIMGNGGTGYMEISGGVFNGTGSGGDIMANGGNAYLYITGGTFQKTGTSGAGTFGLVYTHGTSLLQIDSGTFAVTTLDLQNNASTTNPTTTTGTIQLNGGTLSVGSIIASNPVNGTRTVNLNGGTVASRANATWGDIIGVDWILQKASIFNIGHTVAFSEILSGVGGFNKTGDGNFTLNGVNTYTGQTIVSAGGITVGNNSALGAAGTGNGTTVSNGGRLVLANGVTVTGESLIVSGGGDNNGALQAASNATATWAGSITLAGTGETRIGSGTGGNLILSGDIDATASTVGLAIRNNGNDTTTGANFDNTMVTLSGTYTGSVLRHYQGVLKLGASDRIQDTAGMVFGHNVSSALRQRFDLNGFNETVAYVAVDVTAGSASHEITNSAAALSTLTLDSGGGTRAFSGIVTGNLALQKLGSNTVSFSGVHTYTGGTTVGAGTFTIADGGALNGGGSLSVAGGATFNLNSLATFRFNVGANGVNNRISGAGTANLNGILDLNLSLAELATGNSWQLVDASGVVSWTGLRVTSTSGDFARDNGVWTLASGDNTWTFTENTGVLSVVVVPEPGVAALALAGLAGCIFRRRREA